jgi:hypothetical protein
MLNAGGGYVGFLMLSAASVAIGALLFLALGSPSMTRRVGENLH